MTSNELLLASRKQLPLFILDPPKLSKIPVIPSNIDRSSLYWASQIPLYRGPTLNWSCASEQALRSSHFISLLQLTMPAVKHTKYDCLIYQSNWLQHKEVEQVAGYLPTLRLFFCNRRTSPCLTRLLGDPNKKIYPPKSILWILSSMIFKYVHIRSFLSNLLPKAKVQTL